MSFMLYVLSGSSKPLSEVKAVITPISQLRKLGLREVEPLAGITGLVTSNV